MIIISNKPGQLGNLLFLYAHFLAYGFENSISIANPAFYEYRSYFTSTCGFSFYRNRYGYAISYAIARLLHRLGIRNRLVSHITLDWVEEVDLEKSPNLKSALCFVQGWLFRSDKLLNKHKEKIQSFFTPEASLNAKLDLFFKENFSDPAEIIIGIHIRHGDYKTFEGGKYYYSVEQYVRVIQQLNLLFKNSKPHFLICSNETQNFRQEELAGINITFAPGHELLDMYSLSRCHYIAGPPSTYSAWASFYGNKPLYMIKDVMAKIAVNDFKIALS